MHSLLSLFLLSPFQGQETENFKLVWSDEFNGSSLDYSKWGVEENALGGGNNELQALPMEQKKNVRVEGGNLILEAHKDSPNMFGTIRPYSSVGFAASFVGTGPIAGLILRAKLPIGRGIWPAIWMLPTDEKYGGWAIQR